MARYVLDGIPVCVPAGRLLFRSWHAAWALININALPMIVDIPLNDCLLGTYIGLYYISGTLAAIIDPILNSWIIGAAGKSHNTIFWIAPAFMVVAIVCMWFVTRGEARSA